jgi:hypothetical protein
MNMSIKARVESQASLGLPVRHVRSAADSVAKVFLRHATQILRAIGATIE